MRDLTRGQCVIAVPYADADLVALSRSGAVDLTQLAIASSSVVADLLTPVKPAKGLFWPAGGTIDQRTLVDLAAIGPTTILADPGHLRDTDGRSPYQLTGPQTAHGVRALPIDPLVSRHAHAGGRHRRPAGRAGRAGVPDGVRRGRLRPGARRAAAAVEPRRSTSSASTSAWPQQLVAGGYATPRSLMQVTSGANRGSAVGVRLHAAGQRRRRCPARSPRTSCGSTGPSVTCSTRWTSDNTSDVDPNQLLSPMQYGLLRGVSTAWRGQAARADRVRWTRWTARSPPAAGRSSSTTPAGRSRWPPGTARSRSSVGNSLPVAIVVRIRLSRDRRACGRSRTPTSGSRR